LPHKDPPASFVEAACEAAAEFVEDEFVKELEDNTSGDERANLEDTFDDLAGNKKSGLDDLISVLPTKTTRTMMTTWRRKLA
jgi:hypothetical protein